MKPQRLTLTSAFVTEHPWKDEDMESSLDQRSLTFLKKERQGARYLAIKTKRRKRVVVTGGSPSQKRKLLPKLSATPQISKKSPHTSKSKKAKSELLPLSREEELPHTRTRQKHLLKPVEKHRPSLPDRLLYSDYFGMSCVFKESKTQQAQDPCVLSILWGTS